jgi:hypothetical protein
MSFPEIVVCDGKYTLIMDPTNMRALRHGEPWRDLLGDGFIMALGHEILRLKETLAPVAGPLTTAPLDVAGIPRAWFLALIGIQRTHPEAIIAGGALRDLDNNRPVKDVDIFVHGKGIESLFDLRTWLVGTYKVDCDEIDEKKVYPISDGNDVVGYFDAHFEGMTVPTQIIMLRTSDIGAVDRMDYGICRISFDGTTLTRTPEYIIDQRDKVFRLRIDRGAVGMASSVHRFARLQAKYQGWPFEPFDADPFSFAIAQDSDLSEGLLS